MDPLGIATTLVSLARHLGDVAEKVQQNREECRRLSKHAQEVAGLVDQEYKSGAPSDLQGRLAKLSECVANVQNLSVMLISWIEQSTP